MKPTIVIVGRPNVGKSMLFNRLTKTRDAIVADMPGLTRDRHYGHGRGAGRPYLVVDTGGFEPKVTEGIMHEMAKQTLQAIAEADAIIFVVDGRQGMTPQDKIIGERLRKDAISRGVPISVAVNKTEGMNEDVVVAEFHELGLGEPIAISAAHGEGVRQLIEDVLADFPDATDEIEADHPKIAIVGRPNVGKSSLLNALAQSERAIVTAIPGTTRDVLRENVQLDGIGLTLVDTAGLRESQDLVEREGMRRARAELARADVALLVTDSEHVDADRALLADCAPGATRLIAHNKIDLSAETARVERTEGTEIHIYLSAQRGDGLPELRTELVRLAGAGDGTQGAFSARSRHVDALERVALHLHAADAALREQRAGELAAEELREAQRALGEITGEFSSDDLLGAIFSTFCIGK